MTDGARRFEPMREVLCPLIEQAARVIHNEVWGEPYSPGKGPMHHAGGTCWHNEGIERNLVMPQSFRKKPVVIEAMQFKTNNEADSANINAVTLWVNDGGGKARHDETLIYIDTLEGEMKADVKDWIIKGVAGEFYPCKPAIFEATYEPV